MWYLHWIFSEIQGKVVKITWKVSFLKMLSSKDMTLYLMQAVGSEPSTHPDLISSTMLSKGVSFQKPGLEGWAMAPPIKKTRHTTLIDAILTPGVVWRTAGEIVIVSTRTQWLLYSYFKFSTYSVVPVRIVLVCTPRVRTYDLLSVGDGSVRESYLIRILPQASDP